MKCSRSFVTLHVQRLLLSTMIPKIFDEMKKMMFEYNIDIIQK
jgi:hypothetical protein